MTNTENVMTTLLRVALYVRASDDRKGLEESVGAQEKRARAWLAGRHPLATVARVYVENDTSATKGPRPVFNRMVADAKAGEFDLIVGDAIDRLTRSVADYLPLAELATKHGVGTTAVSGDLDLTTDSGRLVATILAAVAQGEVERKGARQRNANLSRAAQGLPYARCRAYGYELDGITVRVDEAIVVARMFAEFVAGGSLGSIVRWTEAEGIRTTRGGLFSRATVRVILTNARYAGVLVYKGEAMGPGAWPALVDPAVFDAAQAIMSSPARRSAPHAPRRRWLGTGIYKCGVCADGTTVKVFQADGINHYVCDRHRHLSRKAENVDAFVVDALVARCSRPDALALLTDTDEAVDLAALHAEATVLRARLADAAEDYTEGVLDRAQMRIISTRTNAALDAIESRMATVTRHPVLASMLDTDEAKVRATWEAMPLVDRRTVLDLLLDVTIEKSTRGGGVGTAAARALDPKVTVLAR